MSMGTRLTSFMALASFRQRCGADSRWSDLRSSVHRTIVPAAMTVVALAAFGPAAATTTFVDTTFNYSDYSSSLFTHDYATAGSTLVSAQTTSGNPGTAYESDASFAVGGTVLATAVNSNFVYDPSTSGTIGNIDVSLDRFILGDSVNKIGVANYTLRILAVQGGNVYESIASFPGDNGSVWHTLTGSDLTANDFGLFSPTNLVAADFTKHPNFSGGPITFGFAMARGGTTIPFHDVLRADNFSLTINGVPEPATWALSLVGLGLIGGVLRRQRALQPQMV